jgi:O-antigen/teichoic acid export membrane protein
MASAYSIAVALRLLAIGLNAAGAIFMVPFILGKLGEEGFGIWAMSASIAGYLMLLDLGIGWACTRFLAIHGENKTGWLRTFSTSMVLALGLGLLMLVAAAGTQLLVHVGWLASFDRVLADMVSVLLVEAGLSIPLGLYRSILRVEVRYVEIGVFEVIRILLRLLGIPLILWLGGGLMSIVLYSSAANVLFFAAMLVSVYIRDNTTYFFWRVHDWRFSRTLLSFGKYLAVDQAAAFFKYRIDNLLVWLLLDSSMLTPYAFMTLLIDMFTQVLTRFQSYWDTLIMRDVGKSDWQSAHMTVLKSLGIGISLVLLVAIGTWWLGDEFLTWWVGKQYAYLDVTLALFTLSLISSAFQFASAPYLNALGMQRTNALLGLLEIGIKLLLVVPLSHFYGFQGIMYSGLLAGLLAICCRSYVMLTIFSRTVSGELHMQNT